MLKFVSKSKLDRDREKYFNSEKFKENFSKARHVLTKIRREYVRCRSLETFECRINAELPDWIVRQLWVRGFKTKQGIVKNVYGDENKYSIIKIIEPKKKFVKPIKKGE